MKNWRKRRKSGLIAVLLVMVGLVAWPAPQIASAHPLGNFTVNRYSRLEIGAAGVNLYYVLDIAEIPTLQEKTQIDTSGDGQISDSERLAYLDRQAAQLQTGLVLKLNNQPVNLKLVEKDLTFLTGQGGLQTTRLTMRLQTAALNSDTTSLSYTDNNYGDRLGWKEIVVRNADGVALQSSSASSQDQSDELRNYPQDMLASPLNLTSAQATFRLDPAVHVTQTGQNAGSVVRTDDPFAALITGQELTLGFILFAFGAAFVLGMAHAFSPGHGKTVVGAYLVGSRGTTRHALFLGLTVTVTHTIGVFALGLITLFASQFILPEKLYPWLSLASGLLVLVMGLILLRSRWRSARLVPTEQTYHDHSHHEHDHNHHEHDHDHSHTHALEPVLALSTSRSSQNPAATALVEPSIHSHADHDHDHPHDHDHSHTHDHEHNHDDEHGHDHGTGWHTHGPGTKAHSHLPPGADGTPLTWKRLLLFGISAGLLPCPSALIVMLSAISLNRTAFGLVLIIFFSLGLAATLTGIGLVLLYARDWLARRKLGATGRMLRWVPLVGALAVTMIGVAVTCEGLAQVGLLGR